MLNYGTADTWRYVADRGVVFEVHQIVDEEVSPEEFEAIQNLYGANFMELEDVLQARYGARRDGEAMLAAAREHYAEITDAAAALIARRSFQPDGSVLVGSGEL